MNTFKDLLNSIKDSENKVKTSLIEIPSFLLSLCVPERKGLSAREIASRIISRQAEAGAPVGPAADGSQNISEAMEVIRCEEMIRAIKMDARVDGAIKIGEIQIQGVGESAAGPVHFTGFNVNAPSVKGIIR